MRVIDLERGKGKTTLLVSACFINNMALIVHSDAMRRIIKETIPHGSKIDIYTIYEVFNGSLMGKCDKKVYVDEIDIILEIVLNKFGVEVNAGTITI